MARQSIRRTILTLPNGFTLANLMFGVWAIVTASRGDYTRAGVFVVLGGVADALDGRVARATHSGSRFGEELDSLVDAISFGLAPALIIYFAVLNKEGGDWLWAFLFVACAVMRLARFNVEQAGQKKTHFHGLPSPAAGMTLATYYWFSQTSIYQQTGIGDLPWHDVLRAVMAGLAMLMISDVEYPVLPTIGFRSARGILASVLVIGGVLALVFLPKEFFFPILLIYVLFGLVKDVVYGILERVPTGPTLFEREEEETDHEPALGAPAEAGTGRRRRRRRRRHRGSQPTPTINRAVDEGGE